MQQKNRRLNKKLTSLKDLLTLLKRSALVSDNCIETIEKCFNGAAQTLLIRQLSHLQHTTAPKAYPPELRSFALTLHFYSAKAYDYVRKVFSLALPHPTTLVKWYRCVDGGAGFSTQVFDALHARADKTGKRMLCSLIMDEMAIRRQVEWDVSKYVGYVDLGLDADDDSLPVAKEVLLFLIVCINEHWKAPVGYFLIDGLNGQERSNLLLTCLMKLHGAGVDVVSVTFDGCSANLSMASQLGCTLNSVNPNTCFPHPADTSQPVYIMLDACHMLKLMRNLLAERQSLVDAHGR